MTETETHDARIVAQFTRWARPFAEAPLHSDADAMARLLAACALAPGQRVLDVACGPGIVACAIAPYAAHVTGIDMTPAMIAEAQRRQRDLGLGNLAWQIGDATALPFPDESFDRVVSRYALHHLQRPAEALAEMRRVCRRGGRVVVADATPDAPCQAAYDRMETLRDPSHASALTREQLRDMGRAAGLAEAALDAYRLEARLSVVADADDIAALTALFEADIAAGTDSTGVGAWRAPDGIHFHFPASIVAWHRPA